MRLRTSTPANKTLKSRADTLRRNLTDEEKKLWYQHLSKHRFKFYRQYIIGNYIVDFCCLRLKLIIELDGIQHFEENAVIYDKRRTEYLESLGFYVLRFGNDEIKYRFNITCDLIDDVCKKRFIDSDYRMDEEKGFIIR